MAKLKSKNQIALCQARERMEKALQDVTEASAKLDTAKAVLVAYEQAYYGLNGAFARPKSVAPSAVKKSSRKDAEALARRLLTESGANTEDATVNVSAVGGSGD